MVLQHTLYAQPRTISCAALFTASCLLPVADPPCCYTTRCAMLAAHICNHVGKAYTHLCRARCATQHAFQPFAGPNISNGYHINIKTWYTLVSASIQSWCECHWYLSAETAKVDISQSKPYEVSWAACKKSSLNLVSGSGRLWAVFAA